MKRLSLRSAMCHLPALDERCGDHREREIDDGEAPEPAPVARHLPQARAHLVEADEAIDRKIGGKDIRGGLYPLGDGLARPGEAGEKELRQAGAEKDERRRFRMLE